jgi:hypothetical protein
MAENKIFHEVVVGPLIPHEARKVVHVETVELAGKQKLGDLRKRRGRLLLQAGFSCPKPPVVPSGLVCVMPSVALRT